MEHGILLSGADNIDFMIHGVFKYSFFGHEVWITTTHVCVLIVMLIIIGFAIVANRCMAKAREVPEGFSECGGADRGEAQSILYRCLLRLILHCRTVVILVSIVY